MTRPPPPAEFSEGAGGSADADPLVRSRVDLEEYIEHEACFSAADAVRALGASPNSDFGSLTICILQIRNGHIVVGTSNSAIHVQSGDARHAARADALRELAMLESYFQAELKYVNAQQSDHIEYDGLDYYDLLGPE